MGKPDDISEEAWKAAQSTDADINAMCMTWRHDFGLNAPDADADDRRAWSDGMSVGMTQAERDGLRLSMRQVWHHCVAPVVARAIDAAILSAKAEQLKEAGDVANSLADDLQRSADDMQGNMRDYRLHRAAGLRHLVRIYRDPKAYAERASAIGAGV